MAMIQEPPWRFCRLHGPCRGECHDCELTAAAARPAFQNFWRCLHHPSCIENFFEKRVTCEHNCHLTELKSSDNGFHPQPRGSREWADLQRNGL